MYADTFLAKPEDVHHYQELLVFRERPSEEMIAGVLQIQPHTTMRDVRQKLQSELGFLYKEDEDAKEANYTNCALAATESLVQAKTAFAQMQQLT